MIVRVWNMVGRVLFWATRPAIWVIIWLGPPRTRVVVEREGQILLVKDWLGNGRWKLPGGGLHRYEDPRSGAVRELREEVSLTVSPQHLEPVGEFKLTSSGARIHILAYSIKIGAAQKARINRAELSAGQWLPLDNALKLPLTEATEAVLQAFRVR